MNLCSVETKRQEMLKIKQVHQKIALEKVRLAQKHVVQDVLNLDALLAKVAHQTTTNFYDKG